MEARPGQHQLGPHVVDQRVVIRYLLEGQAGPTGGPAMTDVLGVSADPGVDGVAGYAAATATLWSGSPLL
ncbi:MAG: hypothetical protein R2709_05215 [Marmoricola sp.]